MRTNPKSMRHELKYYIRLHDYEALRTRLRTVCEQDKHSVDDQGYHIRSLYFDDMHDSALFEKNYGIAKRHKYRIRIYNKSDAVINLERKSKVNEYVSKESAPLTRSEYEAILDGQYAYLADKDHPLLQDFYYDLCNRRYRPITITDYVREAYVYPAGNVRVTFDKQLMANVGSLDIFDPDLATVHAIRQPVMIMEVKYDEFLPEVIKLLLQIPAHHRMAISKYVICREESLKYFNR